ncbi:MAG TPA: cupin domain-containing protein [Thermoanaerobaculia bacterium]|nr:cupin domain-containing protein [Thermoanaerobaculia bacterium]
MSVVQETSPAGRGLCFEDVIAPVSAEEFFAGYWERRHLILHRDDPAHYGPLFSFADVDRWIAASQGNPAELLLVVPPPGSGRKTERKRLRDVNLGQLYAAFHAGNTLVLEDIQKSWPPVAQLAASLAEAFSARVNVNLYMTPANAQGAPLHPDVQDVFVLQMDGVKDWYLYEQREEICLEGLTYLKELRTGIKPQREEPPLIDRTTLRQGDFLYIPRGLPHKAVAPVDSPSLHLTVCITPVSWVDFLKAAVEVASIDQPELARAVSPGFVNRPESREELAAQFADMLGRFAEAASYERTLHTIVRSRLQTPHYPADGHFAQLVRLGEIGLDTLVRRRAGMTPIVESGESGAVIRFAGSVVGGPAAMGPALGHIRDHEHFRVRDLPGLLDDASKAVLVRRLVREGLLRAEIDDTGEDTASQD